jgi:hypothetical protein
MHICAFQLSFPNLFEQGAYYPQSVTGAARMR